MEGVEKAARAGETDGDRGGRRKRRGRGIRMAMEEARVGEADSDGGGRRRRRGRGRRTATEEAEKAARPREAMALEGKEMPMALEVTEAAREMDGDGGGEGGEPATERDDGEWRRRLG
ncbi:Os11g0667500 [Oryza sativa Japonica Group]|uniref:Os11g0667500 protein n=2 Tax=Oryza sativa TaxID=4530 RepID=A0A0P0Y581_ORYSJ|nr:hypothetical protein OsI_36940 [Oryza sativa Indica Group]BAT15176.1 Os11g0667500 [Oryza sativa Japonica Group]